MKYKLVIFDFDGTIADTSEGIMDSHRFALSQMGREEPTDEELHSLIGGNLLNIYISHFGFSEPDAREAVRIYRERYARVGIHKAQLYPGFKDVLVGLKKAGASIGIATLKAEVFANQMIKELGISEYFDCVCGMDSQDGLTKAGLVKKCVELSGNEIGDSVLVGDTEGDRKGAYGAGTDFVGVSYGFGYSDSIDYGFICCSTCKDLTKTLLCEE